ncbi:ABC transporter substrate-binding protein [Streptomyces sp. NPDC126514]|uniref:ABC transporter substrate-binding protein n=1 Tax=Streptomyces sp. NPDC126514 TaxID=3155210 RepID=UPI003329988A
MRRNRVTATAAALAGWVVLVAAAGACDSSSSDSDADSSAAESAADLGGMEGLVQAAQEEGTLNVIALPPSWANYKEMIKVFSEKYDIRVVSRQPDASSQEEINAAKQLVGTDRAPDVFDLGLNVALVNTDLFAPYKVSQWKNIPQNLKDPDGRWTSDYGGYMSIGYDESKVPAPASVQDLLKPEYKGKVVLNGDPTQSASAFYAVITAALANGGSADDIAPGVEFFAELKKRGNLLPVNPTPATISSGQTPVVFDWDYLNTASAVQFAEKTDYKVMIPENAVLGSYYVQAINKEGPNPAAARLWQEFLFSEEGQNIYLNGYARPVRLEQMVKDGTVDKKAYSALPAVKGTPVFLTSEQVESARKYLSENWANAVG